MAALVDDADREMADVPNSMKGDFDETMRSTAMLFQSTTAYKSHTLVRKDTGRPQAPSQKHSASAVSCGIMTATAQTRSKQACG